MKLFYKILPFALILLMSCSANNTLSTEHNENFSKLDIKNIIDIIEINSKIGRNSKFNYHLKFTEVLNDTTVIVDIVRNSKLPILEDRITNFLKYKNEYIFVYDSRDNLSDSMLKYLNNNQLISTDNISPFFIADTRYWNLYVVKNGQELVIKEMKQLLNNKKIGEKNIIDF